MNWLTHFCEKIGADIHAVRRGIGSDKRIGQDFLWAGVGYGGSCFPKDIRALRAAMLDQSLDVSFIDVIESVNQAQKELLGKKMLSYFATRGGISGKSIAILGLSFKPDTDDMREAPSLVLIKQLLSWGCNVRLFDPIAMKNAKALIEEDPNITWCSNEKETVREADAVALVTEWKHFRFMDFKEICSAMKGHAFFDGRNQYDGQEMMEHGFDYISIGRSDCICHDVQEQKKRPLEQEITLTAH
jgi:UDPglucose 6-dehydrogenase